MLHLSFVPSINLIAQRLPLIFPEGTEHRNYVIREMAAKTIFVMFYAGAIEGTDRWIRPSQVTRMSDEQASKTDDEGRLAWYKLSLSQRKWRPTNAWYAENTREPVRDETLRNGLVALRAVVERQGLPTTSSAPKYALEGTFAQLFSSDLIGDELVAAISAWQQSHLSKAAVSRMRLLRSGAALAREGVQVSFPNGEQRGLAAGPSSVISKAVIEIFAPRFLKNPTVLWLSESGNKVVTRDEALATELGLKIDASKALPDIILVDIGEDTGGGDMLVVFVEVVATDGPINRERKAALTTIALEAGFDDRHLAFMTAFMDRSKAPFRKSISELAWGSFAWMVSEPEHIIELRNGAPCKLSEICFP